MEKEHLIYFNLTFIACMLISIFQVLCGVELNSYLSIVINVVTSILCAIMFYTKQGEMNENG